MAMCTRRKGRTPDLRVANSIYQAALGKQIWNSYKAFKKGDSNGSTLIGIKTDYYMFVLVWNLFEMIMHSERMDISGVKGDYSERSISLTPINFQYI